ncbi:MAG: pilus assembly protein [Hydrogenophaga sp.]|uniref:pilus assembly protein n=1 Tax=Hydrogenophaga sp. TaxID=1904254 RepID=UPI0040360F6C
MTTLGGGGRGYYVIDVTRPVATGTTPSSFRPEGVLLDRSFSGSSDAPDAQARDIGHIYAQPVTGVNSSLSEQIVKLNNGRWAVVMGNGVNSVNERPVLLVQYLDGNRELQTLVAHSATNQSNGLSAPRLVDVNGDGTADIAYAGDLQGNLWKFHLISTDAAQWGVASWTSGSSTCRNTTTCIPLFVARDAASPANRQPITTAPLWMKHPMGGNQLLFGTGRNLEEADRSDSRVQTIYSVWDPTTYVVDRDSRISSIQEHPPITTGRNALVRQSVTSAVTSSASGEELPTSYFNSSRNEVRYSRSDTSAPRGWYMDLPVARERVLSNPSIFQMDKIVVTTTSPPQGSTEETCTPDVARNRSWTNVLNMFTGQPPRDRTFGNTDSTMNTADTSRHEEESDEYARVYTPDDNHNLISLRGNGPTSQTLITTKVPGKRADWLEIQ